MRIAFLSDVHANLPALRAALELVKDRGAERIVVAGDLVGHGPHPAEVVALLRENARYEVIRGNVDRAIAALGREKAPEKLRERAEGSGKKANRAWTALALERDALDWLERLPPAQAFAVRGVEVLVVHGSPRSDEEYIYPSLTPVGLDRVLSGYAGPPPDVLVSGHSHVPFVNRVRDTLVINCGSVGRPADLDPRGSLALAEVGEGVARAEIVRFDYPVEELVAALASRSVPGVEPAEYRQGVKEVKYSDMSRLNHPVGARAREGEP